MVNDDFFRLFRMGEGVIFIALLPFVHSHVITFSSSASTPPHTHAHTHPMFSPHGDDQESSVEVNTGTIHKDVSHSEEMENTIRLLL